MLPSLTLRAGGRGDGHEPAFHLAGDVPGDNFRGEALRGHARHRLGVDAEEAAIAGLADEWPVEVHGMRGKAEPEAVLAPMPKTPSISMRTRAPAAVTMKLPFCPQSGTVPGAAAVSRARTVPGLSSSAR